jgi:hypothetical protein
MLRLGTYTASIAKFLTAAAVALGLSSVFASPAEARRCSSGFIAGSLCQMRVITPAQSRQADRFHKERLGNVLEKGARVAAVAGATVVGGPVAGGAVATAIELRDGKPVPEAVATGVAKGVVSSVIAK